MEDLLKPDIGVMILTICNFLLLAYLLKKFAWKGIISALEKREQQIASDKQQAQEARADAEKIKAELEEKLNRLSEETSQKIAQAVALGQTQREQLLAGAKEEAERMLAQAREQIAAEKDQALADVRDEIVRTAVLAAKQVVREDIDASHAQAAVERVLNEIKQK